MGEKTPLEKMKKANDEYHEAVQEILLEESIDVSKKCAAGAVWSEIFARMKIAQAILEE